MELLDFLDFLSVWITAAVVAVVDVCCALPLILVLVLILVLILSL